jgi:hypothetical protein
MIGVFSLTGVAVLAILAGCSTHDVHTVPVDSLPGAKLAFLKAGETSKDEAVRRLGQPTGTFQSGIILTYTMEPAPKDGLKPVRWEMERHPPFLDWWDQRYSLVLVFDASDLLRDFSLVKVR